MKNNSSQSSGPDSSAAVDARSRRRSRFPASAALAVAATST
jgi:hypothetical protein